jgi:hypothetical protein
MTIIQKYTILTKKYINMFVKEQVKGKKIQSVWIKVMGGGYRK